MLQKNTPQAIGRYEVIERVGRGGMGVVYLGRDPQIGRPVAIKLLRVTDDDIRERFLQEARSAGRLKHPNIVTVYDFGEYDDQPYIVMEFVEGTTLAEVIRERSFVPLRRKLELIEALASGLDYAHNRGVVHRDVKPANLMIDAEGALRILDFGVARVADSSLTLARAVVGTPNYMSPEQVEGRPVDRRSDIFAVGLVMYELLSYRQAFGGDTVHHVMDAIVRSAPVPLSTLCPDVDPGLVGIVDRAIAKDANLRFQTMSEMAGQIARIRERQRELRSGEATIVRLPDSHPRHTPIRPTPRSTDRELLSRRRRELIEGHIAAAQHAYDAGDYAIAVERAEEAALVDPDDRRVIALLDNAHAGLDLRQARLFLQDARKQLANSDIPGAVELLARADDLAPDLPEAQSVRTAIESAKQEMRLRQERERLAREDAERMRARNIALELTEREIGEAEALIANDRFDEALARLARIEPLEELASAREVAMARAQAGAARWAETARKAAELQHAIAAAERALAADRLGEAVAAFNAATRIDPRDERLPSLQAAITAQQEKARTERLADEAAAKCIVEARILASSGRFDEGIALLEAAIQHPRIVVASAEIRAEQRESEERAEIERQKKASELAETLERAERLIRQGAFVEALGAIDAAGAMGAEGTAVAELRGKAQAGLALQRAQADHERRAADAISRALKLFADGQEEAAFAELNAVTPDHPRVSRTLSELRAEIVARDRRAAINVRIGEARSWFSAGKFDEALAVLDAMGSQGLDTSASRTLRAEIESFARERAERRRGIEEQLDAARAEIDRGNFDAALSIVERCRVAMSPGHPAEDLGTDIQSLMNLARSRRDARRLLRDARSLLDAGKPEDAMGALERAVLLDSAVTGGSELRAAIHAAIRDAVAARARMEAATTAIARAREAEARGDLEAAAVVLANVAPHPLVDAEKARIEQAIQRARKDWEKTERSRRRELARRTGKLVKSAKKALNTDLAGAMGFVDAVLHEDPAHAEAWDLRLEIAARMFAGVEGFIARGKLDAAAAALEEAARLTPEDVRISALRNMLTEAQGAAARDADTVVASGSPTIEETGVGGSAADYIKGRAREQRYRQDVALTGATATLDGAELDAAPRAPIWRNPRAVGAAAGLATAAIVAVLLLKPVTIDRPPPPPVTAPLVIDATPWGEITDIRDERQQPISIERPSYTPLRLSVAAGRYVVTLQNPAGGRKTATVDVTASGGQVLVAFDAVDPRDYVKKSGG
jgi:serine/threonine-protein kinase